MNETPKAKPATPHPIHQTKKEAFLLKPDLSDTEWRKTILGYIQAFSPGDPVGLIILCNPSGGEQRTPAVVQEKVLEVVRESGKAAFADILLIENPADLVATLRKFPVIHRIPFNEESANLSTPVASRLKATIAGELPPHNPVAPPRETSTISSSPAHSPAAARRLLTIIDYAVQPYSIGDFLVYLMGSLVAAESAGAQKVDLCLLSDPSRPHADPIMRSRVNAQNHYSHLMSFLPLVELHPQLGSLFIFDTTAAMMTYAAQSGENYDLWPSAAALGERKYMYYDIFKMLSEHHRQHGEIPRFKFSPDLSDWTDAFFHQHAASTVPVTVNLRNNPDFHAHRNYSLAAWKEFFERCHETVPVKFIITGAASEVDPSLRTLPNVVFAKDHQTTLLQDLALIHFATFHLGSSSGPTIMAIFGTKPYYIFNCDCLPYLAHYGGAMLQNGAGELQCSFAQKLQSFGVVLETADEIWHQFQKIWCSRDWVVA